MTLSHSFPLQVLVSQYPQVELEISAATKSNMKVIIVSFVILGLVLAAHAQQEDAQRLFAKLYQQEPSGRGRGSLGGSGRGRGRNLKGSKGCQTLKFYVKKADVAANALFSPIGFTAQVPFYKRNMKNPVGIYSETSVVTMATQMILQGIRTAVLDLGEDNAITFTGHSDQGVAVLGGGTGDYLCAVGSAMFSSGPNVNNTYFDIDICLTC